MSKYAINDTTLTAIGDAIREKEGSMAAIPVADFANRIISLPTGGGESGEVVFPGSLDNPYSRWNENWMPQLNYNDFYMIPSTSSSGYHMAAYFLLEFEPEIVAAGNAIVQYHKATGYSQTVTGKFFIFDGTEKTLKYDVTSSNTNYLFARTLTEEDMYLTPEGKYQIYFYVPQCYSSNRDIMQLAYGYAHYDYTIKAMTYVYSSSGSGSSSSAYNSPLLYNPNIFPQSPCIEHIDTYLVGTDASKYMLPYYSSSNSTGTGAASAQSWIRCKGFNLRNSSSNANSNIVHMPSRNYGLIVDNDVVTFRLDKCSASKILIDKSENYTPYTYADKKMINFAGSTQDKMIFTASGIYVPATYRMFIDFSNFEYQGTSTTFYIYSQTNVGRIQWEYLVESLKTLHLPDTVTTKHVYADAFDYYNLQTNYPELEAKLVEMGFTLFKY